MISTQTPVADPGHAATRTVIVASTDAGLRSRLRASLSSLRWQVREAKGGADAIAQLEETGAEAMLLDSWLPDLDVTEFVAQVRSLHPALDLVRIDSAADNDGPRSPRRNELLHALREAERGAPQNDTAVWVAAPVAIPRERVPRETGVRDPVLPQAGKRMPGSQLYGDRVAGDRAAGDRGSAERSRGQLGPMIGGGGAVQTPMPDLVGTSPGMNELRDLIRLVAPRTTSVLIEGETGSGKEVVARLIHHLSQRSSKPFVVLNCAAIPESLLEAELFGHTRGAFTGAVQSRTGRIEAAHGGTLFLDEIGEMPLALQAKMLRFLENGELQRVGDNDTLRVDVRVVAATHQLLERRSREKTFRLDLYHRLAVFPIEVPALRDRPGDLDALVDHFLDAMGQDAPRKRISVDAMAKLRGYDWPGNVRQLMHVLERGVILAEERLTIQPAEIRFGRLTDESQ